VTFKQLHEATEVDLYVVAADVSRREPIVFHHLYTPHCQVADAVMASASIPFAFVDGMLTTDASIVAPDPDARHKVGKRIFRTVVDGGVWVNFPMFVFKDSTFHEYMAKAGLEQSADKRPAGPIVGFMLNELVDDEGGEKDESARRRSVKDAYTGACFERGTPLSWWLAPVEQTYPKKSSRSQWRGANEFRWPDPRNEWHRRALVFTERILDFASGLGAAVAMTAAVITAELFLLVLVSDYLWNGTQGAWTQGGWVWAGNVILIGLAASIYIAQLSTIVLMFLGALFTNFILLRPARRVLYGLAMTLIATPGTSPWDYLRADVIALEIPASFTTLKIPKDKTIRDAVIGRSFDKTKSRLREILREFASRENAGNGELWT
ncbi:MAG: hypothetical protein ACRD3G_31425, partial [Vicinamibacterales bacterium]